MMVAQKCPFQQGEKKPPQLLETAVLLGFLVIKEL